MEDHGGVSGWVGATGLTPALELARYCAMRFEIPARTAAWRVERTMGSEASTMIAVRGVGIVLRIPKLVF
jgi:hypothetical protein